MFVEVFFLWVFVWEEEVVLGGCFFEIFFGFLFGVFGEREGRGGTEKGLCMRFVLEGFLSGVFGSVPSQFSGCFQCVWGLGCFFTVF